MGFPVGCTEVFFPTIFLHLLSLLDLLKRLILYLFRLLGLPEFLHSDAAVSREVGIPLNPPASAVVLREFLPVVKFSDVPQAAEAAAESCAVCLYEFEGAEEIRWLTNCKHIFHRGCVDRWMDHDQKTCPLCRTPFVPDGMMDEFNQRLWAASGIAEFDSEFNSVLG
ncbi:putative E3 ubiquitin-protein ligase RHA1A, partial [Cucurbita argyrosperma subsp. argyrosperma]